MTERQAPLEAAREYNGHVDWPVRCSPDKGCGSCRVLAALIARQREEAVEVAASVLPPTFYAGLEPSKRIEMMVGQWQKAITVNLELETQIARLEAPDAGR